MQLQRSILRYMCTKAGRDVRSVALRANARGYVAVQESYSTEQKIDQLHNAIVSREKQAEGQVAGATSPGSVGQKFYHSVCARGVQCVSRSA